MHLHILYSCIYMPFAVYPSICNIRRDITQSLIVIAVLSLALRILTSIPEISGLDCSSEYLEQLAGVVISMVRKCLAESSPQLSQSRQRRLGVCSCGGRVDVEFELGGLR